MLNEAALWTPSDESQENLLDGKDAHLHMLFCALGDISPADQHPMMLDLLHPGFPCSNEETLKSVRALALP